MFSYIVPLLIYFYSTSNFVSTQNTNLITDKPTIRVGIAAAVKTSNGSIGWGYSGGAVPMALQYLKSHGYLSNFDFQFHVEYTECDLANVVRAGLNFMKTLDYDVIIGPPCAAALKVMGTLSAIYQKPVLGWGIVSEWELFDTSRFPYMTSVLPSSETLGAASVQLLQLYGWNRVVLLFYKDELDFCHNVVNDVEFSLSYKSSSPIQVVMKVELYAKNNESTISALQMVKSRARVLLFCAQTGSEKRDYLIKAAQMGMNTSEYVHIMLSMRSVGFGVQSAVGKTPFTQSGLPPIWESFSVQPDGYEEIARSTASKMLVIDLSSEVRDKEFLQYMTKNIVYAVRDPPISCSVPECLNANATGMGPYARHLFDVFYMYGMAVSNLNSTNPSVYRNMSLLMSQFTTSFEGMTGEVKMDEDMNRQPLYQVYGLDSQYDQISLVKISLVNDSAQITLNYNNEERDVWHFWGGSRPPDTPICGFLGKSCSLTLYEQYRILIFVLVAVAVLIVIAMITCATSTIRHRRAEQSRLMSEWKIPSIKLRIPDGKQGSRTSLSQGSEDTESTTSKNSGLSGFNENYIVQYYENDLVLTTAHQNHELSNIEMEKLVKLRKLDHENVMKFIGLSIDGSRFLAIWKMCSRGSLQDIISRGIFSMDYFFMFCIIRDIAEGINYLHKSFLRLHGNLRSATCLVNESWQIKLADYGLNFLKDEQDKPVIKRLLWVAPEVLRGSLSLLSSSDVYSFAIIASEILTKKEAWNLQERKEGYEEIIYTLKKGTRPLLRPELNTDPDVHPTLIALVKDCWSEDPEDRPTSQKICEVLQELAPDKKDNLMDHVFQMLEEYASSLEVEVKERTKELTVEKKKCDILLGRMLPKQVAERLKAGQTVEPEGFDSVTVFFSDLVKFTDLAAKCSPFQVVNLLNDVFSNFDSIIEKHDVYKVESIGDGFLCVSGLPNKNGSEHIKQIVDMSLQFMNFCRNFNIPHLPMEKLELRIGINSGSCVAGVVGLSMPRYCLFGDTVNTASRMESNGKPSMIHMSEAAHSLLTTHYPFQYETNSRGEVIIKGKGVMETFWVLGKTAKTQRSTPQSSQNQWKARKAPGFFDESITIRSVSPYVDNLSDDEEQIRRNFRNDLMKVA